MSSMIFLLCHVHACDHARARFRQATGFEERHSDQRRIVVLLRHLDMRLGGARTSRSKHHRFTESQIFESQVLEHQRYVLLFHFKRDVIWHLISVNFLEVKGPRRIWRNGAKIRGHFVSTKNWVDGKKNGLDIIHYATIGSYFCLIAFWYQKITRSNANRRLWWMLLALAQHC